MGGSVEIVGRTVHLGVLGNVVDVGRHDHAAGLEGDRHRVSWMSWRLMWCAIVTGIVLLERVSACRNAERL